MSEINNSTNYQITEYDVLIGDASNQVTGVNPSTATYVLTSNGPSSAPSFQANSGGSGITTVNRQVFTTSGTYTPTSGMVYCDVEIVGGGGGGGGVIQGTNTSYISGGGGAGGYSRKLINSSTIGSSQSITIGSGGAGGVGGLTGSTGGTTSVGTIFTCSGGSGGICDPSVNSSLGGAGGSGSSGDFNTTGEMGLSVGSSPTFISAGGGSCFFGGGAYGFSVSNFNIYTGSNAQSYGGGGGGAVAFNVTIGNTANGGNGAPGIVIITEYII